MSCQKMSFHGHCKVQLRAVLKNNDCNNSNYRILSRAEECKISVVSLFHTSVSHPIH